MSGTPRYEKLKNLLRDKITSGKYQPGQRFYSQNELMVKYELSFSTVTRALDELEQEGYLSRKRGKGTFVEALQPKSMAAVQMVKRICVFAPCTPHQPLLSFRTLIYKHLELLHPESLLLKYIPHGIEPEDLEPFLFKLEPTDKVVFLYPVVAHMDFIRNVALSYDVLVVSHAPLPIDCFSVITSFSEAAAVAIRHLAQLGHKRIAFIGDEASYQLSLLEGYRQALTLAAMPFEETLVVRDTAAGTGSLLAELIAKSIDANITAVFATSTVTAVSVLAELRVMGEEPGQSISLMCYDDLEKAGSLHPGISTVSFSSRVLALEILQSINALDQGSSKSAVSIDPVVVPGSSVMSEGSLASLK